MDGQKSFEAARAESIAANREFIQGNPRAEVAGWRLVPRHADRLVDRRQPS
jgi:hypothetical protein